MEKKVPSSVLISGWIAALFISLGTLFKLMHWPGASMLTVVGSVSCLAFYLPLWLANEPMKGRILLVIYEFSILFLSIITFLFKTMHWPFGNVMFTVWMFSVLFVIFPVSIVQLFRSGHKTFSQFHTIITLFLLGSMIVGGVGSSSSRLVSMANSFSKSSGQVEHSIERLKIKNKQLYEIFETLPDKSQNVHYQKAARLNQLTDSVHNYLTSFRRHIIAVTENIPESSADSLPLDQMRNMLDFTIPTQEIWGNDEYKPRTGKFSGSELKSVLNMYRDSCISLLDEENRNLIRAGINLNTDDVADEEGESHSWEEINFRYVTLPVILITLKNIEMEVMNAETQVLADLLSSTKVNSGSLVTKVAELGAKLESEKKEKEIQQLKNQQELSQVTLQARRAEVDSANRAIVFFVVGILLCLILIFFVIRSNMLRKQTNLELKEQKHIVEEKNKEITDSITYAKRLQEAILPSLASVKKHLPDSFVLYKPKDIVAGDFYWMNTFDNGDILVAAADCTGHGVPGAMVSVVCSNALNRTVNEFGIREPGKILDKTRELVIETFERSGAEVKDGMDISLAAILKSDDTGHKTILWAGANNPLWYIENGELKEITANKQPIGKFDNAKPFTTHKLNLPKGSSLFLFTDGYADQFGGPKGKKFKYKQLNELILSHLSLSEDLKKKMLEERFIEWKGKNEQVDDVCVIGIRL
jgi:serine phosphatase RsbU (regulator of sigma subunit)